MYNDLNVFYNHTNLKRTTLSSSLTLNDKKKLMKMALKQDITVAALILNWIMDHGGEQNNG